jgi:glycine betaine/proline transport system substrate-binding protein
MRVGKKSWFAALIVVGSLVAAACGGGSDSSGSSSGSGATIVIARNNWSASAVGVEIAKILIEENLGNKVEILDIDENAMFAGLSAGDLHVNLEVWPSGVTPDEQAFIDDGSIVNMGELGAIGKIGWFVPEYVLEAYPNLATSWEALKDPAVAKAFATAATGSRGRFLGMDASFSQYDEGIIQTLGLPFEVQFSGSEAATQAEIAALASSKKPLIMYYWTPSGAVGKYNLKNVALPTATVDCAAEPGSCDGDYPQDVLFKIASAKLKDADAKVFAFVQKFVLSTEDQLSFLGPVDIDGVSPKDAARAWVDANKSVWSAWFN